MLLGCSFPVVDIGTGPAVVRDYAQAAEGLGYTHLLAPDRKRGDRTLSGLLDAQSFFAGAQCHGMSSSMRLCGQPLTSRVSRSVK